MKMLTGEWLQAAQHDLDLIEEIIHREDLTHLVAFHAEQAVEKVFKSLLEEDNREFPKIHNLVTLHGLVKNMLPSVMEPIEIDTLNTLNTLYIDSRYPGEFGLLPNGKPTLEDARVFYRFAQDIHANVSDMLAQPTTEDEPGEEITSC